MPRSVLAIVEEFRRSSEAQHRKNAVTALAVIADDDEAISQLVETALMDTDLSVRERAQEEILSLQPNLQQGVVYALRRGLRDPKKRQAAYGILGRLRSCGLPINFSRFPFLTWIRLTLGLNTYLYPLRNWKFRTRSWKHGVVGGIFGVTLLVIFFLRTGRLKEDYGGFIIISMCVLLFSPAIAVLATQRTNPVNLYLDHFVGFLTEILSTLLFATLGFTLIFFFYVILLSREFYFRETAAIALPLILGVFAAVVRGGTLIAYGRFVTKRWNWVAQVIVGVATGFVALTFVNLLVWKDNSNNDSMAVWWMLLFSISFVIGNAFAAIDNETTPIRPFVGRVGTFFCILTLLPTIAISVYVLKKGRQAYYYGRPTLNRVFDNLASRSRPYYEGQE